MSSSDSSARSARGRALVACIVSSRSLQKRAACVEWGSGALSRSALPALVIVLTQNCRTSRQVDADIQLHKSLAEKVMLSCWPMKVVGGLY
jgi:hypothetical protein